MGVCSFTGFHGQPVARRSGQEGHLAPLSQRQPAQVGCPLLVSMDRLVAAQAVNGFTLPLAQVALRRWGFVPLLASMDSLWPDEAVKRVTWPPCFSVSLRRWVALCWLPWTGWWQPKRSTGSPHPLSQRQLVQMGVCSFTGFHGQPVARRSGQEDHLAPLFQRQPAQVGCPLLASMDRLVAAQAVNGFTLPLAQVSPGQILASMDSLWPDEAVKRVPGPLVSASACAGGLPFVGFHGQAGGSPSGQQVHPAPCSG